MRVELVVGSLVVEVVVCLSRSEAPFADTVRLIDNKATDDTTQTAINNLFVFIMPGFNVLIDPSNAMPTRPAFIQALKLSGKQLFKTAIMAKYSKKAQDKVEKTMHERKEGTLRSSSGQKVTSRQQAIAIGLSEAREAGAKVPAKPSVGSSRKATKKSATKKSAAKK